MKFFSAIPAMLLIVALASITFAQYAEPPLGELLSLNSDAAYALEGYYDQNASANGTVSIPFGGSPPQVLPVSASVLILSLSPMVDGVACAGDGVSAIFARGYQAGGLVSLPSEGYPDFACDREWFEEGTLEYAWRCDFDGDSCAEYVNRTIVEYDLEANFSFRNVSEIVPFSSTYMEVPPAVLGELQSASGAENLSISLGGTIRFIYEVNDREMGGDCTSSFVNSTVSIPYSANASFPVGGSQKLFFLRAPVLREQWYRNNRFDTVVLSQCPLYRAAIYENGNMSANMTLKTFNITAGQYNISSIVSIPEPAQGWSESSSEASSPFLLEAHDYSYLFAYEFNHGYAGLGENNLTLSVTDALMQESEYNETLLSRMLSHSGNISENGPEAAGPMRPSARFEPGVLSNMEIGFGIIGLLLILVFVNFWVPR